MSDIELKRVVGGAQSLISGTFLNAISKLITTLVDLGRNVGSSIAYKLRGKTCK